MLIDVATAAARRGDDDLARAVHRLTVTDVVLVDGEAERALLGLRGVLWDNGWQPAELVRHAARADARAGRVVAAAVAADHTRRDPATSHPRWAVQARAFAFPDVSGMNGWLTAFAIGEELDRRATVRAAVIALGVLGDVGPLPTLIPPPGSTVPPSGSVAAVDDPVFVRVRALLAQAESTTFDAEAAAFTAKDVHHVPTVGLELVAPREGFAATATTCGELPLGFRRQAGGIPRAVRLDVMP